MNGFSVGGKGLDVRSRVYIQSCTDDDGWGKGAPRGIKKVKSQRARASEQVRDVT